MDKQLADNVILASASRHRRDLLERAGVRFRVVAAAVDEAALRRDMAARRPAPSAPDVALELAAAKAGAVAREFSSALVIGADQVLDCEGEIFSKPADVAAAADQLGRLAGRVHRLHSALVVSGGGSDWRYVETATMTMRALTRTEIERYLERAGPGVCDAVGAYHIEALGIQLFAAVEGDYFTIVGLPLLALLGELRRRGALEH